MSFNTHYGAQSAQDYTYGGAGYAAQSGAAGGRQASASSVGSVTSNGADTSSTQLYMGDLDPSWTEGDIKQIWAALGEANVQVKLIKNSSGGGNSGYCFVEFPSNLAATNALLKTGLPIPVDASRTLKLNWASFATTPGSEFSIFVGDLAPNVTESQLFELFISRYSSTLNAKIVFDQGTGVSKGYGFVKFGNEAEQQRSLLEMQGVFLNGRAIRVSTTSKNKSRFQGGNPTSAAPASPASTTVNSPGLAQGSNTQTLLQQSQFIYPVQQQPALSQFADPNNTTVFIGGLSSLVTEEELRAYFQPFGQIVYVKIPVGKGCGFVQYVDRSSAENAIAKMQGFPIGNSRVRLSWGRSAKQTAAMQQAFAMALQQQQQQQQQSRPQHSQPHQYQHQQHQQQPQHATSAQPLLQQQLQLQFPYQHQPAMPQAYGYTVDSMSGTGSKHVSMHGFPSGNMGFQPVTAIDNASAASLLPNLSSLDYSGFPSSTTTFNFSPTSSLGTSFHQHRMDFSSNGSVSQATQAPTTATSGQSTSHPQILVQGGEAYVKGKGASLDRLEQGSNGYIFV
ncbi:AaceriADR307Wp [[Ashbya] aceris (nom. inval.)]|nr:AaceriADR307Wp [[Ashbya] aceris (nom. inval.)]